jgi:exonuclease III
MSLFSVNCRGAGNASTVRELRDFVSKFAPAILCIQETQISKACTEALATSLGFDRSFAVGSDGRSGGLGIYWNNDLTISVLGYSKYHIDVSVIGLGDFEWRLTAVYGEAQVSERYKTWDTLKAI